MLASGHQLLRAQTHAANDVVAVGAIVVKDVQPQDVVRSDFSALDLQSEWPSMENRIRAKNGTGPPASVRSRHAVREGVRTPKSAKNRHSGLKLFFLGSQLRAARPRSLVCQAISRTEHAADLSSLPCDFATPFVDVPRHRTVTS